MKVNLQGVFLLPRTGILATLHGTDADSGRSYREAFPCEHRLPCDRGTAILMKKTHLDWNEPPLASAAAWLAERFDGDLSGVIVALPGARSGRILRERLARRVGAGLQPPTIVTAGLLTDELLELGGVPAGRLVRTLAWERALRKLPGPVLRRIVARPPAEEDLGAWLRLAEEVRGLFGEVAADGLDFGRVAKGEELAEMIGERARWAALAEAQEAMHGELGEAGLIDPHLGRLEAIEKQRLQPSVLKLSEIVLVGVVEMNALLRRTLELCDVPQTALVFAPESSGDAFDELGCLVPEKWIEHGSHLPLEDWYVVDGPDEQARRTAQVIGGWNGAFAAEQITIGIADPEVTPFLKGRLAEQGCLARDAAGTPFSRTAPALLLEAVGAFLDGRRFSDYAAMVRHPDFDAALRKEVSELEPAAIVDDYHNAHLPSRVDGEWLGADSGRRNRELFEVARSLWEACLALCGELAAVESCPLGERVGHLRGFLVRIYGARELQPSDETDRVLHGALRFLDDGLTEVETLPASFTRGGTASEVIGLVLRQASAQVVPPAPPKDGEATIELLGWLELALDDAPALVVTGFENGRVPESKHGDTFLPDSLRRRLGLIDDERRLARDLYVTELLVHSRDKAVFLTGRRSLAGEPQVPSRIVFHCDRDELMPRVRRFLDGGVRPQRPIVTESDRRRELPRKELGPAPEAMRVTDFRLYLGSPYEYYLRRILDLESLHDDIREIDAGGFGDLGHKVLQRFGQDRRARGERDAKRIERFLSGELQDLAVETYGAHPLPAVRLQLEQLDYRLRIFAERQAARRLAGWEIREVEWSPSAGHGELAVDGAVVQLRGRIDRIDAHPEHGWAIWDYKTSEGLWRPETAHRTHDGKWRDLQLPLYCLLVQELLDSDQPPELGYAALCREPAKIGFYAIPKEWRKSDPFDSYEEGIGDAIEAAQEVIRCIRRGEFFDDDRFGPYDPILGAIGGVGLVAVEENDSSEEGEA